MYASTSSITQPRRNVRCPIFSLYYNIYQSLMDQQPFRPEQESSATMPTATATFPLHEIAQRINHHERELADLRKEYELRQTQLTSLTRRKEDLQTELDQVEAEIANIDQATVTKASDRKSTRL